MLQRHRDAFAVAARICLLVGPGARELFQPGSQGRKSSFIV